METLKSKLKVVWAVAAAVVILLGGLVAKDALAGGDDYHGYEKPGCVNWKVHTNSMAVIMALVHGRLVRSFMMNGGACTDISPSD